MKNVTSIITLFFMLTITPSLFSFYSIITSSASYLSACKMYYTYVSHISESLYFLSHLSECDYCYIPCNMIQKEHCIQIDKAFFFHKKIRSCLHKVMQTKSIIPIITLFQHARHPWCLRDQALMHEVFLLIFIIHKQILLQECKESDHSLKKSTLDTLVEVSDKINQLPITEVLSAIDMLITELPPFLEKYELNSSITWRNWLKKYWWVPPIFGGWFALRILVNFQKGYYYYHDDIRYPYIRPSRLQYDKVITNPDELSYHMRNKNDHQK